MNRCLKLDLRSLQQQRSLDPWLRCRAVRGIPCAPPTSSSGASPTGTASAAAALPSRSPRRPTPSTWAMPHHTGGGRCSASILNVVWPGEQLRIRAGHDHQTIIIESPAKLCADGGPVIQSWPRPLTGGALKKSADSSVPAGTGLIALQPPRRQYREQGSHAASHWPLLPLPASSAARLDRNHPLSCRSERSERNQP